MAQKLAPVAVHGEGESAAIQQVWSEIYYYNKACRVIKDTLEKCAKNYAGVFDEPQQRYTGRDKTFVNLTKWHCNGIASKIKVDAAAITVEANNEGDFASAQLMNQIIQWQLRDLDFDELLAKFALETVIMGTGLLAISWNHGPRVKRESVRLDPVSVLDVFTDPTVDSIQSDFSPSVIVKSVKDLWWVKNNPDFKNVNQVMPVTAASRAKLSRQDSTRLIPYKTSGYSSKSVATTGVSEISWKSPKVVIYERWGKDYKTGEEYVTTLAGQEEGSAVVLRHKVNPFENQRRPFIECWYRKELGRWFGEGAAEVLIPVQSWYNREINQNIDNAESLQNQMFLVRRGAGVDTRQLVSRPAGGILVENIETDVKPLAPTDIRGSFYRNEMLIREVSQRLSGAFDVAIGAPTQASKTLGASVLEQRGATDLFEYTKKHLRGFLKRLIGMMVDMNIQFMDRPMTLRITGSDDEMARLDALRGLTPDQSRLLGRTRFLKIDKPSLIKGDYDVWVDIENALGVDKNTKIAQNMQLIGLSLQDPTSGIKRPLLYQDVLALMGKDPSRYGTVEGEAPPAPQPGQPGQPPSGAPVGNPPPPPAPPAPGTIGQGVGQSVPALS